MWHNPPGDTVLSKRLLLALTVAPWLFAMACGARTGLDADLYTDELLDCAGFMAAVEPTTLAAFFVVDTSASMVNPTSGNVPKLTAMKQGIQQYLAASDAKGTYAGLTTFPLIDPSVPEKCRVASECGPNGGTCLPYGHCNKYFAITCLPDVIGICPSGDTCASFGMCKSNKADCILNMGSTGCNPMDVCVPAGSCERHQGCDASSYAIGNTGLLPGNGAALLKALAAHAPAGLTPTLPALAGALQSAESWMVAHPSHKAVVVLATDGLPDRCDPDMMSGGLAVGISDLATVAASGTNEDVATYVIGVFSPVEEKIAQAALDEVADAGGTDKAFIVRTDMDVVALLNTALAKVRKSAECEYAIPQNTSVDLTTVAVFIDDKSPALPLVAGASACNPKLGGFYYDTDPNGTRRPRRIILCPASCARDADRTIRVDCGS